MILGFSTQLNGKPTHFVEKIWKGLKENLSKDLHAQHEAQMTPEELTKPYEIDSAVYPLVKAKLHTIREDSKDRWKKGKKIDFFINVRKKDMLRFAPVLPVLSVQDIHIMYRSANIFFADNMYSADVYIDKEKLSLFDLKRLARNDGFDTVEDFLAYFNEDFTGKVIHWTDLKY